MRCWVESEMMAGGIYMSVKTCRKYRGILLLGRGWGAKGVCQYRCSVTGCHNSGQEAESND